MFILKDTLNEIVEDRDYCKERIESLYKEKEKLSEHSLKIKKKLNDLTKVTILLTKEMWEKVAAEYALCSENPCQSDMNIIVDEAGNVRHPLTTLKEAIEKHERRKEFNDFLEEAKEGDS